MSDLGQYDKSIKRIIGFETSFMWFNDLYSGKHVERTKTTCVDIELGNMWEFKCEINQRLSNYLTLDTVKLLTPYASMSVNMALYPSGPPPNAIPISSIITGST